MLRVGVSSDPRGYMSLDEWEFDTLRQIWATAGCGVAGNTA